MDILYFGGACSEEFEQMLVDKTKSPFTVAQNSLELALIDGLSVNDINNISVNCMPCIPYEALTSNLFSKSQNHLIKEKIEVKTFPILKLPIIKYIIYFLTALIRVFFWRPKCSKKDRIIFVTINFIPVTLAVLFVAKIRKIKTVCMLTDCARNTYILRQNLVASKIKKIFFKYYMMINQKIESSYDGYVFLTKKMNEIINYKKKPHIILEGIYNSKNETNVKTKKDDKKKIIMYAGSLFKIYGIDKILEVMKYLNREDIELHIYGDGEYKNEIIESSKEDPRIMYKGFVNRNELSQAMQKSTLLINLRNPEYEYTQLSFPSKMMEYMASGTPVYSTMLEGIPYEYFDYIFYSSSYDASELADEISNILSKTQQELLAKGNAARKFILNHKTKLIQGNKIFSFLKEEVLCE